VRSFTVCNVDVIYLRNCSKCIAKLFFGWIMLFREMRAFVLPLQIMVKCKMLIGAFVQFRKATVSFVMSVRPSVRPSSWNTSVPTGRIYLKFDI